MNERQHAAEALEMVQAHQERTRRAARLPWWAYVAVFVLSAGGLAVNDLVTLSGAKVVAVVVLVVLVATLVLTFAGGSAPVSRLRGVQGRQSFVPRVFALTAVVLGVAMWLLADYGDGVAHGIADALGLSAYPYTVLGVLWGAVFTALFAAVQALTARSATDR